jgi:nucleotide-binding universal stress UspA family protein
MMRKILVAYDGGAPAKRALDAAADLAQGSGAQVTVVHVAARQPARLPETPTVGAATFGPVLRQAEALLRKRGIGSELLEVAGSPAETIERIAAEGDYDTIVIGTRDLGPLARAMYSGLSAGNPSVSEHVSSNAQATVVVAR